MEGNMAVNWKRFRRRGCKNYVVISRLDQFEERFKTVLFLSVISDRAMEVFEGMHFANSEDKHKLNKVIKKSGETIEQYITGLRTLTQSCNVCTCLEKTLLRYWMVLGIRDNSVRKKLLKERNLTLAKALDICRSSETMSKQLQNMTSLNEKSAECPLFKLYSQCTS